MAANIVRAGSVVKAGSFGEENFGGAALGDARRASRLIRLADQIAAHPEGSLPQKLGDPASYQAMYRLCKCPEVTHAAVLEPHRQLTLEKMRACAQTTLILHDTTELDYTSRTKLHDQIGQIGDGGGRGYECHNSLAVVAATGELLGVANQILHHRADVPKAEGVAAKREREDRESRLWLRGSQSVGSPLAGRQWVDVCDRGADTFEFLDDEDRRHRSYVVRSQHSRAIFAGHGDAAGEEPRLLLHEHMRSQEAIGGRVVFVQGGPGRKSRRAKCLVCVVAVRILPPHVKRGQHRSEPLCVWAVRVWEIDAPADVTEPLEWLLLTNVSTANLVESVERIQWYESRWIIEVYHKCQKTGCGIESLQFDHVDRLEPMIALLSVAAVMLVKLRDAAREEEAATTPAVAHVPVVHVAVLSVWRYQERRVDLTVWEFFMALARLGGHQNRKSDGAPGWITLWRGWNKLQQMVDYAIKAGVERCDES
jgi:hypothetical protein